ncbi:MAG: DUF3014 domain-containing protein [Litorilituus sp.]|jgi:hypothetical protein|nr:DUF3014 domain-containing protein [Litorilituus sp.]
MDNLNATKQPISDIQEQQKTAPWSLIIFIILAIVGIGLAWQFTGSKEEIIAETEQSVVSAPVVKPVEEIVIAEVEPEPIIEEPLVEIETIEAEIIENPLPALDESDDWLKIKLPELTWRKELLKLVIDEDMIRRFVVFTDNFAQGTISYEHSPFVLPKAKFSANTEQVGFQEETIANSKVKQKVWQWNESSTRRFSLYVDLLRSMDSDSLVQWYFEVKPLIDEAYSELGYADEDFTITLQDAITRVLDMELPKSSMALIRPSVMYHFADDELEALPDTNKLLLRLGKDNLLVMKSVLLELHEKLAQQKNGVH